MKNVLITGVSQGIGNAIACGLSENKSYNLFLSSRNKDKLAEIASELGAKGYFSCDFTIKPEVEALAEFVEESDIDILINDAGQYVYNPIEKMTYDEIERIMKVNLQVPLYLCHCVSENMKSKKWGRIINIGSISGVMGEAYASSYSASKSGLVGMSKALALELAEYGVTVNTINPGWVETELGLKSIEDSEFSLEETMQTIPQKRFVSPLEIEKMIEYLISDDAKGVTGQSINICAGLSLGI